MSIINFVISLFIYLSKFLSSFITLVNFRNIRILYVVSIDKKSIHQYIRRITYTVIK